MPGRLASVPTVLTITAFLAFANATQAQEASQSAAPSQQPAQTPAPKLTPEQEALAQDFYRAEIVIIERKIEPDQVEEKMADRLPEPPDLTISNVLRHTDDAGETRTTLKLVPQEELHLSNAAKRLKASGKYRVLLAEGWYQAFPPDFEGKPLWVNVGDWLPGAEHTDVQGQITIDRQRYLHVNVQLNHWLPKSKADNLLGLDLNAETPTRPRLTRLTIKPAETRISSPTVPDTGASSSADSDREAEPATTERELVAGLNWPRAELLTWIQETRRMRSEEVHFLDSPTLGIMIFFKKIEPEDAAPMILELGLTGEPELPADS